MKEEIIAEWPSVFQTLQELDPKAKAVLNPHKFKANATITLRFLDKGEGKITYEFDQIKPI